MVEIDRCVVKYELLREAVETHGGVRPCCGKSWSECYTEQRGYLHLWYNTSDNSTRIVKRKIPS